MRFTFVVRNRNQSPERGLNVFTLKEDNWDDYNLKTSYLLFRGLGSTDPEELGTVKIGQLGQRSGRPAIDRSFRKLSADFFSLGQDREYYDKVFALDAPVRQSVLTALNDIAFDDELFDRVQSETVTQRSLLRYVNDSVVKTQFRRITRGQAALSHYKFSYNPPQTSSNAPPQLRFSVSPDSAPPTNVHVLIGANGVGKSTLMKNFAASLASSSDHTKVGSFKNDSVEDHSSDRLLPFNNVVTVAFSAFDPFPDSTVHPSNPSGEIAQNNVGLGDEALDKQFAEHLRPCTREPRRTRWLNALKYLTDSDAILRDARMETLLDAEIDEEEVRGARERFQPLSSGHKIVLLTITAIIRFVEERTLVLIDEPETHLHPPLLSAFVRALSELIGNRNGVAIMATHSPVVLQDVPRSCVQIVSRNDGDLSVRLPMIETFGESVSVLTSAVFGLDITATAFHALLDRVSKVDSAQQEALHGQLGAEGRALLRALGDNEEDEDE